MKIAEAVQCAAVFLQLNELAEAMSSPDFNANAPEQTLSAENAAELDLLVRCCNLVLFELADTDFPLRAQTRVNAENGRIDYSRLPQKITDIVSVTAGGKSLPICRYFDCITVPHSGECVVTYTFAPAKAALGDISPYACGKPSARAVAYGIAREYCQISGMLDEASVWDGRFAAAITEQARGKCEKRVKPRTWR